MAVEENDEHMHELKLQLKYHHHKIEDGKAVAMPVKVVAKTN